MTSFELLPEDLHEHISGCLNFTDVLELQQTSTHLKHVTKHIYHISIYHFSRYCSNLQYSQTVNHEKLCRLITDKLETFKLYNVDNKHSLTASQLIFIMHHLPQTLKTLELSRCFINSNTIKMLAPLLPPNLVKLNFYLNMITSQGIAYLADNLPQTLRDLDVSETYLEDDATVKHLLTKLPETVTSLNLSSNQFNASILSGLLPKRLQRLTLYSCDIDNKQLMLLQQIPPTLQHLDLSCWNSFTWQSLLLFVKTLPKSLTVLKINGIDIAESDWDNIFYPHMCEHYPNIEVVNY